MGKVNKVIHSDPNLEELLLSLQIENGLLENPGESSEASEESCASGDEIEYRPLDTGHCVSPALDFSMRSLKEKGEYKISRGSLPFSLFEAIGKKERREQTVVASQKFFIEGGKYDYGFTPEDLRQYDIKRRKKTKRVCPNWEDIAEEKRNEPRRICVRSLQLKNRR
ncbi:hypothetical protein [Encephalitozoon cuniculi GB-M1]|uniref:Uncharacterized protein n=2 Tax=Encephalitozoon cuniculi TaxID=6035 RepID=Q8SV23_ENCCU|nr:uncharacterized protein ECU07_0550 [Encephalitozoon cuniculi GB-M1]AGE95878.1 hypothetical protein ECU07_0550 [Encephalitozoon cuniculi]KMV65779.1 hypothetical protein M970_070500 [Encephalitozoon cuniculi EcunIII-L]UYI27213.1 hypothetical protein J0A71_05g10700 [Encephalitozoon cuniculi]CAD25587.1 hypothetical protein [Encephalitozoon cuniculi GB-M1]